MPHPRLGDEDPHAEHVDQALYGFEARAHLKGAGDPRAQRLGVDRQIDHIVRRQNELGALGWFVPADGSVCSVVEPHEDARASVASESWARIPISHAPLPKDSQALEDFSEVGPEKLADAPTRPAEGDVGLAQLPEEFKAPRHPARPS